MQPAVSLPNPCSGGSLCGSASAASNIMLVQANDVVIHDMTLDGDNPGLTSGIVRNGADGDARNGIIDNYYAGVYNGMTVYNVTVQNIYLRGIYAASGGTGLNIHDNTVTNIAGDSGSIGIFSFGGGGMMVNNTVSYANDAIAANHSQGIQFLNNTVTNSGSGVHTDNAGDGGGTADLIQGNTVSDCASDGYGVWTFVTYIAPTVDNNTITNCSVGLSAWGGGSSGPLVTTQFTNNTVNGPDGAADSVGAYITTDTIGWGYTDVAVNFTGNVISGNETGVFMTADAQSWNPEAYEAKTITATFSGNEIADNTVGMDKGAGGTVAADAVGNWWGDASGPYNATSNATGAGNSIADGIPFIPWLGMAPVSPTVTYLAPTVEIHVGNPVVTATATPGTSSSLSAELGLAAQLDLVHPWDVTMWTFPCTVTGSDVSCPTDGLPEGEFTATVTVFDDNGHIGNDTGNFTIVDDAAPVTTDNADSDWHNSDVTVTLSCDDGTLSGCDTTYWSTDQGESGTGNAIITVEGDNTLTYHSTDNAGNVEADNTVHVYIDKTDPVVGYTGPSGTVYSLLTSISGTVSDPAPSSGIDSGSGAVMSLDGGVTFAYSCTITGGDIDCPTSGLADGSYDVVIEVTDSAGNSGTATGSFVYDAAGMPELTLSVTKVYWASYSDYSDRKLSVNYLLTNTTVGRSAIDVNIVAADNTNGVSLLTATPVAVGDIPAGLAGGFTLKYVLPIGVMNFKTSIFATASDPAGNSYAYPGPPA